MYIKINIKINSVVLYVARFGAWGSPSTSSCTRGGGGSLLLSIARLDASRASERANAIHTNALF